MPQSDFWPFTKYQLTENQDANGGASILQKQLGAMEGEVKEIQMELAAIRKDRMNLYIQKRPKIEEHVVSDHALKACESYAKPFTDEQFTKSSELSKLKEELIRAKNTADEERFQRENYERKLEDLELKLNSICRANPAAETKETRKSSDEEIASLKNNIRDMKEEMEELRITLVEKSEQLHEYRMKYLQAQQQVEELKRQMDVIDYDNKQVSDQIHVEIQRMKIQFQEKLQELAPLPDLLKGAQIQLQEAQQLQKLAEDNAQNLSAELNMVKEKLVFTVNNLNQDKVEKVKIIDEVKFFKATADERQKEIDRLEKNESDYKTQIMRLSEKLNQQDQRVKEKATECAQLLKDLDEVRMESSRSMTRSRERSDTMRRYLQAQISELERQLIQSRAQFRACLKERDEYLQAQQQVEELKRQMDVIDYDNKQVSDQIHVEIQRMKIQFQEKLQELAPLPDLLKGAQIQLQEAQQLQKLAEDNAQNLSAELNMVKEKLVFTVNNLNQDKVEKVKIIDEVKFFKATADERQKEIDRLEKNESDYKTQIMRLSEKLNQQDQRVKEKATECAQLLKDLDEVRMESSRSMTRSRERSDTMRRYLQAQISELERQLIQSRAQFRACLKERDELRQRMQLQISNLQENFELVEVRLRGLHNQVGQLKATYTAILSDEDDSDFNKISTI